MPVLADSRFALVAHGVAHGPPAGGVKEHLVRSGARVECLFQPLGLEQEGRHVIESWQDGRARRRTVRLPSRPPYTYPFDPLVPFARGPIDVWIGFDSVSTARGLTRRRLGRVGKVVHWAVDFVPDRFGPGSPLTRAYDALDRVCCTAADLRVEVSQAALDARSTRLGLDRGAAPALPVPIGLWADEARRVPEDAFARRRAIFVGHLVERMGVATVIRAVATLREQGSDAVLDIVGMGPESDRLEALARELGVHGSGVVFHGYRVGAELEERLAAATVAVAPYQDDGRSFTQYADPSKLKSYLAAGLPILLTPVPPNAHELQESGAAEVVEDSPEAFAEALGRVFADEQTWVRRRRAALDVAARFDWPLVMAPVLDALGYSQGAQPGRRSANMPHA